MDNNSDDCEMKWWWWPVLKRNPHFCGANEENRAKFTVTVAGI
jgi:hypothetical protein